MLSTSGFGGITAKLPIELNVNGQGLNTSGPTSAVLINATFPTTGQCALLAINEWTPEHLAGGVIF